MTPDQREAELRRRVARFRSLSRCDRVALPASEYGHFADCGFLLDLIDALRRVIAHAPTAAEPTVHLVLPATTTLPTAPTIPAPPSRADLPWSDPANRV